MKFGFSFLLLLAAFLPGLAAEQAWLSDLDLTKVRQGWGKALANKTVTDRPLALAGQTYDHGVGTHAPSVMFVALDGKVERFTALCGVDDHAGGRGGSVVF
jgi:alpha-galactosidase